jgi:hypothetical protein
LAVVERTLPIFQSIREKNALLLVKQGFCFLSAMSDFQLYSIPVSLTLFLAKYNLLPNHGKRPKIRVKVGQTLYPLT